MECTDPKWLTILEKEVQVPCGKCIPCLCSKRSDWSFRLEQEHKHSKSAHFVTLTYDEKHVPTDGSLNKRHLQLYLKRLRRKDETVKIRYYAVGEYGGKTGRPHYHLLLFNADEANIRSAWKDLDNNPVGIVHVGRVTPASVAYVTKYVIQKSYFPKDKVKPFSTMSRAYGIGAKYLTDEMVEYHRANQANFTTKPGNIKGRLPRFYRDKIWPNVKLPDKPSRYVLKIKAWHDQTRQAVSSKAMELVLSNRKKELEYWQKKFPTSWELQKGLARDCVLARVKQKIEFSQHL